MKTIRILIINPWSGVVGPNVGLLQLVKEGVKRNHRMHVLFPVKDEMFENAETLGAKAHLDNGLALTPREIGPKSATGHSKLAYQQLKISLSAIKKVRPNVICINAENMLFAPLAAKICKIPFVIYVRGARFVELKHIGKLYFGIQKIFNPRYIAVSNYVSIGLRKMGVSERAINIIPNGVDLDVFRPIPKEKTLIKELGIPINHSIIGAICHLTPRKGIHHILEIMKLLMKRVPRISCIVVGKENEKHYKYLLEKKIKEYNLADRIKLLGERQDVSRIISCLDVLVHPSETESFGRTIAESMAMGKPVVGFDIDAVPELVTHGVTGYIAEPFNYDEICRYTEKLLRDNELKKRMGLNGLEKAKVEYDVNKNIGKTIDLLEMLSKQS